MRPLDILACDSANKPSFQNPTKSPFAQGSIDALFTSMPDGWSHFKILGRKNCFQILSQVGGSEEM